MQTSELLSAYPYTTELHAHTSPVSLCANFSPESTVEFYQSVGASSLVITNHLFDPWIEGDPMRRAEEYLADYYRAVEAAKGSDLNVILGVELRFLENVNDYLIYGVSPDDIPRFISLIPHGIENFYRKEKNARNVILQAHPFRDGMVRAPLSAIDGVEVFNMHPGHNSRIAFAAAYAKENGLLVSGGSDFHHEGHQATCLMRTPHVMRDSYDVAASLAAKNVLFDLKGFMVSLYY